MATKNSKTPANSPVRPLDSPEPIVQAENFNKAMHAFHQRDFRKALPLFERAAQGPVKEMAHSARTHLRMCESRLANGDPDTRNAEQNYNYGIAQMNLRNYASAATALEISVKQQETDYTHYALAAALGQQGQIELAAQHLRRAIQMQPRNRTSAMNDPDFSELAKHQLIRAVLTGS